MRFELLEALLRVVITMRDNANQEDISPAEKVRALVLVQIVHSFCQILARVHGTWCAPTVG